MEKRFQVTEVRAKKNGDKRTITGYAARYNVLSSDLGGFRERIASGAFKRILATNPDVVCLFNHSDNAVLGRTTAGTGRSIAWAECREKIVIEPKGSCFLPRNSRFLGGRGLDDLVS